MKLYYILFIFSFLLASCSETNQKYDKSDGSKESNSKKVEETSNSEKLSKRWILIKRTNSNEDKVIEFDENNSSVITFFEDNGYFRVYDSLINLDKKHGVKKIENRQSGQWEILENELVLRYTGPDTVILESLEIVKLNNSELILKNKEKDQINQYIRK